MAQIQRYGNEPRIIEAIRFRESQFTCEREHRHVVAQNASVQTPHAVCTGILEQPLEQACANAASLPIIGDHHGEFVRRDVIIASVSCDADDVLLTGRAVECDERHAVIVVHAYIRAEHVPGGPNCVHQTLIETLGR